VKLPGALLVAAVAVFVVSLAGVAFFVGAFTLANAWLWDRFGIDSLLAWGAALLGALAASSGLLLLHLRGESYVTFERVVLALCLGFSLSILALLLLMIGFA
jgi:hypothetical protein